MTLAIGGLGWPYDDLVAAALVGKGRDVRSIGAMDREALDLGRASLPRGACAPALFTTGALVRAARWRSRPQAFFGLRSCGPCRFALFDAGWKRALRSVGAEDVAIVGAEQSIESLESVVGQDGLAASIEAIVAGDALAEMVRRIRPYASEPDEVEHHAFAVSAAMEAEIRAGVRPIRALAELRGWERAIRRRPPEPLARAVIVGEPWSLHVDGDPQLNLARVLGRVGVEVEIPPLATWIALQLWERREPWTRRSPTAPRDVVAGLEQELAVLVAEASRAAGIGGLSIPSIDELADLASPHLSTSVRGGYGHVEVGLAVRARRERRGHLVISVKSFGCMPSSGVSDAILPTALGSLPFLSLEVSGDGEAARESRLMLRVAAAREAAIAEVEHARAAHGASSEPLPDADPLSGRFHHGPRPYASTLACTIAQHALDRSQGATSPDRGS